MNMEKFGIDELDKIGSYYHDCYVVTKDDIGPMETELDIKAGMLAVITTDGENIDEDTEYIETFEGTYQDPYDPQFRIYFFRKVQ